MMKKLFLLITAFLFSFTVFGQIAFEDKTIAFTGSDVNGSNIDIFTSVDIDNDNDEDIIAVNYDEIVLYKFNDLYNVYETNIVILNYGEIYGINSIDVNDIDGDGDMDILVSSDNSSLVWLENIDGNGNFSAPQLVNSNLNSNIDLGTIVDIDGDGDNDILFHDDSANYFYWIENTNGLGAFNNNPISIYPGSGQSLIVADIDMDNDLDIVVSGGQNVFWYENYGSGVFTNTSSHSILNIGDSIKSFQVDDVDYDGDNDIIVIDNSRIFFIYNLDGQGDFFNSYEIIYNNFSGGKEIDFKDIDNDGLKDMILGYGFNNSDNKISWMKNLGGIGNFDSEIIIDEVLNGQAPLFKFHDIDGDNDLDITISYKDNIIKSIKNLDGLGNYDNSSIITKNLLDPSSLFPVDIDNDGDFDLVCGSDFTVSLFENIDGNGNIFTQKIITTNASFVQSVFSADLDNDGDMDIISASASDDKIAWYENLNGLGEFGAENIISLQGDHATLVFASDIDNDGDIDVLSGSTIDNTIAWYENTDGLGNFGVQQIISSSVINPSSLSVNDIDNDGDIDVLTTSSGDNTIGWFKNLDGQGSFGAQQIITSTATDVRKAISSDIDNDGDLDIVSVYTPQKLVWFANDGSGSFGIEQLISYEVSIGTFSLSDIDSDGDIDILGLASDDVFTYRNLVWFENLDGLGNFDDRIEIMENLNLLAIQDSNINSNIDYGFFYIAGNFNKIGLYENLGILGNEINGIVSLNVNMDGICDNTDLDVANVLVYTDNGSNNFASFTNLNGSYQIATSTGNFNTTILSLPNYFQSSPISQITNFVDLGNTATIDFCIEPIGTINDLNISVYPSINDPRPGFNTTYQIVYNNVGTTQLSGNVTFEFDDAKLNFLNASETIVSQTANTLTFNFTDLNPFETRTIDLEFNVFAPPTTNIDDVLVSTATVNPVTGDNTPDDNVFTLNQTVIGSYDPNDIRVLEGDQILLADADKYLHYIIRFQNTGTASAISVNVENVLDSKLDWTTMQLESLSHTGRVEITNGSMAKFIFDNINLPDSTSDEPNSHGYIAYKIKPKDNVVVGDIFNSTADIFFDFNPAIVTNTVSTEIINTLSVENFEASSFSIFPNPANNILNIEGEIVIKSVTVYDINGRLLNTITSKSKKAKLDVSNLSQGLYFLEIISGNKKESLKFIKK